MLEYFESKIWNKRIEKNNARIKLFKVLASRVANYDFSPSTKPLTEFEVNAAEWLANYLAMNRKTEDNTYFEIAVGLLPKFEKRIIQYRAGGNGQIAEDVEPEEIERRKLECQAKWSEAERESRANLAGKFNYGY